ncbi:MAG: FliH/SctL family protein [Kineosporiaceae bacterium]
MSVPAQRGTAAPTSFVPDPAMGIPRQGGAASPTFAPTRTATLPTEAGESRADGTVVDAPPTVVEDTPQVRRARFDRPLGNGQYLPTYADPELERIVREAADAAREQARAEGYARGWSQGRAAAQQAAQDEATRRAQTAAARERIEADRINSALSAATSAARDVGNVNGPQWNEVSDAIVDAALQLARAVLARELAATGGEVVEAVRIALRGIADGAPVIAVNPEDYETLTELAAAGSLPDDVHLVPDREVPRGAASARAGARQLVAHLPSALAAAEEALRA